MLKNVSYNTLFKISALTMAGGTGILYALHVHFQRKVRSLPHYRESLELLERNEQAMDLLGAPVRAGWVDLSDRQRNYVGELDSKLRIPIIGYLNNGFLRVNAQRVSTAETFETQNIALEVKDDVFLIYDRSVHHSSDADNQKSINHANDKKQLGKLTNA